jgi:hypothetical protein
LIAATAWAIHEAVHPWVIRMQYIDFGTKYVSPMSSNGQYQHCQLYGFD